jgi:hypothetical protein
MTLKSGTLCTIIAGCPENIGMIVEVIQHIGVFQDYQDAYAIRTTSGRHFKQLWSGNDLLRGTTDECITERNKLRPLVGVDSDEEQENIKVDMPHEALI